MLDVTSMRFTRRTPNRSERRRLMKDELRYRKRSQPGMSMPPVELRPDDIMAMARVLDASERMRFFAILDERAEPYLTFKQYVDRAHPGYLWGAHLEALARRLQDVADGLVRRLMIFMPPRHGKSELVSRLFTAYYVYRHPTRDVALTTYGAELSYDLSRDARRNFLALGGKLATDSAAVKSWHTSQGGNVWATGVGGPATGRGFHLGVIDDPYKDHVEAASAQTRRTRWDWYKSVFRTRAAPGASIILLMTRWHMDDLAANLLRDEAVTKLGWHVVEFSAEKRTANAIPKQSASSVAAALDALLADDLDPLTGTIGKAQHKWPETVTLEDDVRDDVKWLWTQRFPVDEYESLKREQGGESGYFWNALYQQRPVAAEGGLFRREYFTPIDRTQLPRLVSIVRWWDLAATEGDGAYTAGLKVGKDIDGNYYILGLVHGQWHPGKRDRKIVQTARDDGPRVRVLFPRDPAAAGKQVAAQHIRMLSGISTAFAIPESGDKDTRATMPAADAANGFFFIVREPWAHVVLQELCDFGPGAEYRDIVDALSGAHAYLSGRRTETDYQTAQGSRSMKNLRR